MVYESEEKSGGDSSCTTHFGVASHLPFKVISHLLVSLFASLTFTQMNLNLSKHPLVSEL